MRIYPFVIELIFQHSPRDVEKYEKRSELDLILNLLRQDVPGENIGNLDILNEDNDNDELQNLLLPLLRVNILPNVD